MRPSPAGLSRAARGAGAALALAATFPLTAPLAPHALHAQPAPAAQPTLVVLITVDQLRGDYPTRFASQLTGGLGRLVREGAWGVNGMQDHANTETAPGHAATLSGRFPVHTGIAANAEGVNDRQSPLIDAPDAGASPWRFRGTTLVDWMRAADRRTRFLSVSRKDRGAILPIGKSKGDVYWYSPTGIFTQSQYYGTSLPRWVRDYNAQRKPMKYAGYKWTLLLPDSAYPELDSVPSESMGRGFQFPYEVPDDPQLAAASLPGVPVMDELTLDFALTGVKALELGADPKRTDLLAVSLSTTDAIGHRWGPDSRELHDQVLRLDRALGAFLDSLFTLRDPSKVIVALTADHGVTPLPVEGTPSTVTPNPGARFVELRPTWRTHIERMAAAGIDTNRVDFVDGLFVVGDTTSFVRAKRPVDSVATALLEDMRAIPGVHDARLLADLAKADTTRDLIARRWLHMFAPGGPVRAVVTLDRFAYPAGARTATHGSPWELDAWVPVLFWGAPFKAGRYEQPVRVVDIAPTLAAVLGLTPSEALDGVVLQPMLAAPRP
jgi:predicted AlkP superfamily pyrophosphatase or phosphodiesterase